MASLNVAAAEATDYKARYSSLLDRNNQISEDLDSTKTNLASVMGTNTSLENMVQQLKNSNETALQKASANLKSLDEENDRLRTSMKDKDRELRVTREETAVMCTEKEILAKVITPYDNVFTKETQFLYFILSHQTETKVAS